MEMRGIYVAAVTPWAAGDRFNDAALERHIEMLVAAGIDGICVGGSTGEFPRMDTSERKRLLRAVLGIVNRRMPVLAGVGHASLEGTIELIQSAAGAEAVVVPPPYYFPYSQPEVLAFFRCAAGAAKVPVFIYNIPQFTTGIQPGTALRLLADGTCAGIKDSSGCTDMLEALAGERRRLPFVFFCGSDEHLSRALEMGADGGLSGIAACAPELLVDLYRASRAGDRSGLDRANGLLREFIARLAAFPPPVGIRLALEVRGIPVGPHAVPLAPETEQRAREFRLWVENWLLQTAVLAAGRKSLHES
jgi:4-hydroxy-tetrahydrodipicolinate synthase